MLSFANTDFKKPKTSASKASSILKSTQAGINTPLKRDFGRLTAPTASSMMKKKENATPKAVRFQSPKPVVAVTSTKLRPSVTKTSFAQFSKPTADKENSEETLVEDFNNDKQNDGEFQIPIAPNNTFAAPKPV